MRPKIFLSATLLSFAAVAAFWFHERSTAREFDAKLSTLRVEHRDRLALESERDRLRAQLPSADELAALQALAAERDRFARELSAREALSKAATLALGESKSWRNWENHGRATPRAALETVLWAAAGGDTHVFETMIELEPATREKAAKLLARLSPDTRRSYGSPEALVASVSMKNIPLGDAQLSWLHETDTDHAHVALLLRDPDRTSTPLVSPAAGPDDKPPPELTDPRTNKLTFLSLHRTESGWRLMVPETAIDRIAQEFAPPPGG